MALVAERWNLVRALREAAQHVQLRGTGVPRRFADTCDTMLVPRTARVCSQWKADLGNVRRADFLGGSSTWCVSPANTSEGVHSPGAPN